MTALTRAAEARVPAQMFQANPVGVLSPAQAFFQDGVRFPFERRALGERTPLPPI
jgi:hypothetical protein